MQISEGLEALIPEIRDWRRDLHRHPELDFDVERTADFVARSLERFGCDEVVEGVGRTGVVGRIRGRGGDGGPTVALRADMDALPIIEQTGADWASTVDGRMHACGHDGHTAMLLGAARLMTAARDFAGDVVLVFQPAEETTGGGRVMVEDGLMERFSVDSVYGMHNLPGLPVGRFAIRQGPIMACSDQFDLVVEGRGGHAAMPHRCTDTVCIAAEIVLAVQRGVARRIDPIVPGLVSITTLDSEGDAYNVIPSRVRMKGTARSLSEGTRSELQALVTGIAERTAEAAGARCRVDWHVGYPATVNHVDETARAVRAARAVVGDDAVDADAPPLLAGEDFAYMLNARPGAFIFIGNGDSEALHHPAYDFDDAAIPYGCRYWTTLTRQVLAAEDATAR